jgi:hypothetical protein
MDEEGAEVVTQPKDEQRQEVREKNFSQEKIRQSLQNADTFIFRLCPQYRIKFEFSILNLFQKVNM